jgi:hypothetical protein
MLRVILLLVSLFGSALLLDVPITVKETAKTTADGFPVTFVLPLPYGALVDTQKLRVVDEAGTAVPSQFEVMNKYWASTPQYLRHVMVHFQPSVSAWAGTPTTGVKKYFVRDDGQAATPATPVIVQDSSDSTTVVTGPLKMVLRKTEFTVINELWFDANENGNFEDNEKVISHNTQNGGVLVERDGTSTQYDAERTDLTWEVEESGPLRAVIRVDYPTLYQNSTDVGKLKRGAAVRLYAYAGKPFVYIDYQLQNSANVPLSWYLYFKEMNVEFSLTNFNGNRVRVGMADASVYEKSTASPNVRLFQSGFLKGDLYDGASVVKSVNNQSNFVWLSLQDTSSNVAVTSTIRHFWERWPNALAANGNKVSVQLWPKGSATWTTVFGQRDVNFAGLYYLPDMYHHYKESFLYFHKADASSDSVTNVIKLFHNPPVAVVPTSWYAEAKATLDLGGAVPIDSPSTPTDVRVVKSTPSNTTHNTATFGDPDGLYRAGTCTTGGWPYSAAHLIASEDPADYFDARNLLLGEINVRPQWIAKYDFFRDFPRVKLSENPYCGGTWRQFLGHGVPILVSPVINGTGGFMGARDDQHGWFHHSEEAYYLTGTLWFKDWMKFISQFRQIRLHQQDPFPDRSHRAVGHALQHALSSYRVTGDMRVLDQMAIYLRKYVAPTTDPYYGDHSTSGFQTGYLARWNANFMQELAYGAATNATYAQHMAEAFNHLYGLIDWNYKYGHFPYYRDRALYPNSPSSGPGFTMIEPELFTYLITGHDWLLNHTITFVKTGLNGGAKPYGTFSAWNGQYENRLYKRMLNYTRADTQAPAKITDLVAYRKEGEDRVVIRWTPVDTAVRYHGVYCTRPIVEDSTNDTTVCNWWAANAVGVPFGYGPFYRDGQHQYFYFDVNSTLTTYVALFSFDDASNMSPMSNVVQPSKDNVLTLPEPSYVETPVSGNPENAGPGSAPANGQISAATLVNTSLLSIVLAIAVAL